MIPTLHTLCFEAVEDGGEGTGGGLEQPETAAPVEPTAEAPTEPTTEAPAPSPLELLQSPEFQATIAQYADHATQQQLAALLQQQAAGNQQDPFELDPMADPEQFTGQLRDFFGSLLDERLAPLMETHERQQLGELNEVVMGTISQMPEAASLAEMLPAPKEGEADKRQEVATQAINLAATGFLAEAEATYGENEHAIQAAIRAGAQHMISLQTQAFEAGKAAYKAEQDKIAGASAEPGTGGAAIQLADSPGSAMEAADRFWDRMQTS